ncbi:E3 ubiquitin-protein ligase ZNF598 isoform X2 [Myripristis murdjan]|uniref:E3 ubiquitin-protein ligase ZNF598 isoform X2 n=1 Tax=Myripristis murdjan TaxID=586833 RepID=UPI001175D75C|nr:E3 ubiquitin-protein ligase ZNF598 isoform X2 [Myripristis murdjan]
MDFRYYETEKNCVLCCQDLDIFALGKCDHPVCYRCSTKMRVLCEQKYCAVCREELDKVVFVKKLAAFSTLPYQQFQCEKKHDIYFSDGKIYAQFRRLLLPECPHCPEPKVFSRFEELEQHMRKQHELFCCKLCTKHLKIFSHERKWYNRKDLARHRTQGDPDDTSHRGHPLCKFCDDRYLDNDELLKHLRRDHYFCHFCDADGAQEYYSDYQYLSEHFRESHYLCEEGRCATEQFTHAFRTEIDFKAHKAAAHSKNRAEARQNRHIDLQFTYAPRQQRRNEGMVSGEDYEEVRQSRGARGRVHGGQQKSWRYSREEEDREMAAAMRASMAVRRQEERAAVQERIAPKHRKEERTERTETDDSRHRTGPKPTAEPPVRTMKSSNPLDEEDDFPALGATAATPMPNVKPAPVVGPATHSALKEDDFPSLSAAAVVTTPMTPAYSAQPRNTSSFQEEDFPALVSKIRPLKPSASTNSAWSNHTTATKPATQPAPPSAKPPPHANHHPGPLPFASTSGPQLLSSSSSSSSSRRKKKGGENAKPTPARSPPSSDDETGGMTQQEFRAVPTMLDISSLLTVKGGNSKPSTLTSNPSNSAPNLNANPQSSKAGKKKKQQQQQPQKNTLTPVSASSSSGMTTSSSSISMETAAQKENVPEISRNKPFSTTVPMASAVTGAVTSGLANGYTEKTSPTVSKKTAVTPHPNPDPPPEEEEEFPALITKNPPPGFKSSFPMKASTPAPSATLPPPPPGLANVPSKPPPGFTGIPLNSNVLEPVPFAANRPTQLASGYLVPENFQQRNMELIQSIRNYLHNDESQFNQFKNYSGQFRQGQISAALYHRSCKDLLGENFNRIFNELLVLLPDTGKQQELLTAHGDSKALEKQSGAGGGGGKKNKNKKSAWQTANSAANINVAAELDCQVCPTCRQVLAPKDFNSHKTLHTGESEEFPSLQSISRIIS